ncbi:hypothetical protein [Frankia sp. CcI49]|uniref:hypothetical protein n=1 Tax=Frankia sp. CcI49 TaxID=1745382 RepID=UPI00130468D0|nr:hypothetical protein [Frankia sp. CcI49]
MRAQAPTQAPTRFVLTLIAGCLGVLVAQVAYPLPALILDIPNFGLPLLPSRT